MQVSLIKQQRAWHRLLLYMLGGLFLSDITAWQWALYRERTLIIKEYVIKSASLEAKLNILCTNLYLLGPINSGDEQSHLKLNGEDEVAVRGYSPSNEWDCLFISNYNRVIIKYLQSKAGNKR